MNVSPYIFPGLTSTDRLEHILRMCCNVAKVERELVVGGSRLREVVLARQLYFWFARRLTNRRLTEIGAMVNMTHSNVVHHLKTAKNLLQIKDPEFTKLHNRIA